MSALAGAGTLLFLTPSPSAAQPSPWAPPVPAGPSLSVEVLKPFFDDAFSEIGGGFTAPTSATFLTLRTDVNPELRIVGELPLAYIGFDASDVPIGEEGSTSDFAVGNPYLGIEVQSSPDLTAEFGIRIPVVDEEDEGIFGGNALFAGVFADLDRAREAFVPSYIPVGFRAAYRAGGPGVGLRLRAGPTVFIPTGDGGETEGQLSYSADLAVPTGPLRLGGGLSGLYTLTEGDTFDERSIHQIGLTLDAVAGRFRPGLVVRFPLDDELEALDAVVGFRLVATSL